MKQQNNINKFLKPIETLKGLEKESENNLREIREKIELINKKTVLPALKKQYEGKYFKYRNSYSQSDKWMVYLKVEKVDELDKFTVTRFETNNQGEITFQKNEVWFQHMLIIKSTKSEFEAAFKKMLSKIKML